MASAGYDDDDEDLSLDAVRAQLMMAEDDIGVLEARGLVGEGGDDGMQVAASVVGRLR